MKEYKWVEESIEKYHQNPAIGSSSLIKILRSPAHYKYGEDDIGEDTARISTNIHTALLEPERFKKSKVIVPSINKGTKEGKEKWLQYFLDLENKKILTVKVSELQALTKTDNPNMKIGLNDWIKFIKNDCITTENEMDMIYGIVDRLQSHKKLVRLIKEGQKEKSGYLPLQWKGLKFKCKIRPDNLNIGLGYNLDLKTTTDARRFNKTIQDFKYHIQAAYYMDLASILTKTSINTTHWVVIEKSPPYEVQHWRMDKGSDLYRNGVRGYEKALGIYADCTKQKKWPGYPEKEIIAELPHYAEEYLH